MFRVAKFNDPELKLSWSISIVGKYVSTKGI